MRLDTHIHFWHFDPVRDAWITPDMAVLRRDFFPGDVWPLLQANGIDGCVAVQADQSEKETLFLLDQASGNPFVQAVVGWVDLCAPDVADRLAYFSDFPKLKGFRHILQGEKPAFMLEKSFLNGVKRLRDFHFTYDILVYPRHLGAVLEFLKHFENQPFIIDHLAKPYIKRGLIRQWARDMRRVARHENVYCKVSGMTTEADWRGWQAADLRPYLDVVFEAFGPKRVCYGSDWPVCLLAASYERQREAVAGYVDRLSINEQQAFWGGNANAFYFNTFS